MTFWKCPKCFWINETDDDITITFCKCCLATMEKHPHESKKEVEVYGFRGEKSIYNS